MASFFTPSVLVDIVVIWNKALATVNYHLFMLPLKWESTRPEGRWHFLIRIFRRAHCLLRTRAARKVAIVPGGTSPFHAKYLFGYDVQTPATATARTKPSAAIIISPTRESTLES